MVSDHYVNKNKPQNVRNIRFNKQTIFIDTNQNTHIIRSSFSTAGHSCEENLLLRTSCILRSASATSAGVGMAWISQYLQLFFSLARQKEGGKM